MEKIVWDRKAATYLIIEHILAVAGMIFLFFIPVKMVIVLVGLGIVLYLSRMLAITAGYHRHFTHQAFECAKIVKIYFLAFGAASVQYSILRWGPKHINHHARTDTEMDPTNVKHELGLWWAQILCWAAKQPEVDPRGGGFAHLISDPLVNFQDQWYKPIQILVGLVFPALLVMPFFGLSKWAAIAAIGAMLMSFLSVTFQRHATGTVNSIAHKFGRRDYDPNESGADNIWVSIITLGEGQQNRHHKYSQEWHNGIWYDPTGWFIWCLSKIGLAWDLK